jgi:hypothetical protein
MCKGSPDPCTNFMSKTKKELKRQLKKELKRKAKLDSKDKDEKNHHKSHKRSSEKKRKMKEEEEDSSKKKREHSSKNRIEESTEKKKEHYTDKRKKESTEKKRKEHSSEKKHENPSEKKHEKSHKMSMSVEKHRKKDKNEKSSSDKHKKKSSDKHKKKCSDKHKKKHSREEEVQATAVKSQEKPEKPEKPEKQEKQEKQEKDIDGQVSASESAASPSKRIRDKTLKRQKKLLARRRKRILQRNALNSEVKEPRKRVKTTKANSKTETYANTNTSNTNNNTVVNTNTSITNTNTNNNTMVNPNLTSRVPVRIRRPCKNRKRDPNNIWCDPTPKLINPIYDENSRRHFMTSDLLDEYIIPGINNTEESRLLVKTFASRWYPPADLKKIEQKTGLQYRRGYFSDEERILAIKLTKKFCRENNITLKQFGISYFQDADAERVCKTFFVDISQNFGGRPVEQVYDCLKRIFHPGNHRGSWTAEDDLFLINEYRRVGPRWTAIGLALNRLPTNCRDRYNMRWRRVETRVSGPFSQDENEKLIKAIAECHANSPESPIAWIWISENRVTTRSPLQCFTRWTTLKKRIPHDGVKLSLKDVKENGEEKDDDDEKEKASQSQTQTPTQAQTQITTPTPTQTPTLKNNWKNWSEELDFRLLHSLKGFGVGSMDDGEDQIDWNFVSIPGIENGHEKLFNRWEHLKKMAAAEPNCGPMDSLSDAIVAVKNFLQKNAKSEPFIFSDDE